MSSSKTTLFVADVPFNLTEPEFASIFRVCDGFEAARLTRDRKDNLVGFVDYSSHDAAAAALERCQGYKFNLMSERGISIHFSRQATVSGTRGGRSKRRDQSEDFSSLQTSYYRSLPVMMNPEVAFPHAYGAFPGSAAYNSLYAPMPAEASSTLYVEGLPHDATEREVSHIFRLYPGFQSVRIVPKESKHFPNRTYNLCFIEYNTKYNAYIALQAVQDYRMEPSDPKGLTISFAKTQLKDGRRAGPRGGSSSSGASGEGHIDSSPDAGLLPTKSHHAY